MNLILRLCRAGQLATATAMLAPMTIAAAQEAATFRGDLAHTGVYAGPALRVAPKVKWAVHTDGYIISTPAVTRDAVYFGSTDANFYRVDRETGARKWAFKPGARIASSPAVAGGLVYFESYDGIFYALDAAAGTVKWKFQTAGERRFSAKHLHGFIPAGETMPDPFDLYLSSPAVSNGRVYFGSGDGNVYALNAATGALGWKFRTGNVVHASPAIAGGVLYIGSWDSYLYALDAATGQVRWRFKAGVDPEVGNQQGMQASAAVVNGTVYVGCRDGHLYAVDAATGKQRWAFDAKGSWVNTTPAVRDGKVFFGTSDGRTFYQLDAATGRVEFSMVFGWYIFASPTVVEDMAYVANWDGKLAAIDLTTRKLVWSFQTEASKQNIAKFTKTDGGMNFRAATTQLDGFYDDLPIAISKIFTMGSFLSSPVVVGGVLYVGSTDGNLYALK